MSTTMLTKEKVDRKWYILDAAGKPMGKTAALAADLLRGKLRTDYTPHVDCGDYVIIINAKDAVLTGKKLEQKYYRTHSGYPTSSSSTPRTPSSPARSWSRSTTVPTPVTPAA